MTKKPYYIISVSVLCAVVLIAGAVSFTGFSSHVFYPVTDTTGGSDDTEETVDSELTTDEDTGPYAGLSPEERFSIFRYDNFANGRMSDELLDSCSYGTLALLSCYMYYENTLQSAISNGKKWVYSANSKYAKKLSTFDDMVESGRCGATCKSTSNWGFIDMGIKPPELEFYGNGSEKFSGFDTTGKYLSAVCDIRYWAGRYNWTTLYECGYVEPGDVFMCPTHNFTFIGDKKFFGSGHDAMWHSDPNAKTDDARKCVYDSWIIDMDICINVDYKPIWQLRFKKNYIPKYYRNSKGEIVQNPLWSEKTAMEYVSGVSPDAVVFTNYRIDPRMLSDAAAS